MFYYFIESNVDINDLWLATSSPLYKNPLSDSSKDSVSSVSNIAPFLRTFFIENHFPNYRDSLISSLEDKLL